MESLEGFDRSGWHIRRVGTYEDFQAYVARLGRTFNVTSVELNPRSRAQLASAEAMPVHTDHPGADLIAWYCMRQSDQDGASVLVDSQTALAQLCDETLRQLHQIRVRVPVRGAGFGYHPLLSGNDIYYADWLVECPTDNVDARRALERFQYELERVPRSRVRLQSGDALIVNNRRILHGRDGFSSTGTPRLLMRHWLCAANRPSPLIEPAMTA